MRGKVCRRDAPENRGRITPAYAGKRSTPSRFPEKQQDHPRLCGEKHEACCKGSPRGGSPPPMRGKVFFSGYRPQGGRITPAYAGKSPEIATVIVQPQDHPRLCGEKCVAALVYRCRRGSPPPMRGKDSRIFFFLHVFRITPAYAGKSASVSVS